MKKGFKAWWRGYGQPHGGAQEWFVGYIFICMAIGAILGFIASFIVPLLVIGGSVWSLAKICLSL